MEVASVDLMSQPPPGGIVQRQPGCPDRVGLQNFFRDSSPQVAPQTKVSSITYQNIVSKYLGSHKVAKFDYWDIVDLTTSPPNVPYYFFSYL